MSQKRLFTIVGVRSVLEVYDDRVTLAPTGCLLFRTGLKYTKTIPFRSIAAMQLKESGLTSGFLQFTLPGSIEKRGGLIEAIHDENSFIFKGQNKRVREVLDFIQGRIATPQITTTAPPPSSPSVADEIAKLAKLRAEGALTEAEFDLLKSRLL